MSEGLPAGHIGVARLFRHTGAGMAVNVFLGNDRLGNDTCECRAIAVGQSFGLYADTRLAVVERLRHAVEVGTQA